MTSTVGAPAPEHLGGAVRGRVGAVLDEFLAAKAAYAPDECLPPVVTEVREYVAGGKFVRPVFCHCGWLAAGGMPDAAAIARIGAALELFHAFALIHDDIMDGSELRRGAPAMHVRLAALHRTGVADEVALRRFAVNAAILVGDLCLVWSDELLHAAGLAPVLLARARPLLDAMRTEVMAGQYLDLESPGESDWLSRAWRTIGLKTAGYTVERPLQLGAALAGGDQALLQACTAYGRPLGEAFQLRDDLLGVFGDPARTGKPALDDLRDGKSTVLMALTWQRASTPDRRTLRALHGNPDLDEAGADLLRGIVRATGADLAVRRLVDTRIGQAVTALARAPVPDDVRQALTVLAEQVGTRDH
jgi:geranylgeranyl diphosphate synthase type I